MEDITKKKHMSFKEIADFSLTAFRISGNSGAS